MSANVHVLIRVHGVPPQNAAAVTGAVDTLLAENGLAHEVRGPVALGKPRVLTWSSDPEHAVVVTGLRKWLPAFERSLATRSAKAAASRGVTLTVTLHDDDESPPRGETLRTMRAVVRAVSKGAEAPKALKPTVPRMRGTAAGDRPKGETLDARWSDLERAFGSMARIRALESADLPVRFGRVVLWSGWGDARRELTILVTCGLSLAGFGVEFYVVPAETGDYAFAQAVIAAAVKAQMARPPSDAERLRTPKRFTLPIGKVRGTEMQILFDPNTGDLPRALSTKGTHRHVVLLPLTSVTRTLVRAKLPDGQRWIDTENLASWYTHFLRVRDPANPDASKLITQALPLQKRTRTKGEVCRFELVDSGSSKFWSIGHDGRCVVVSFGRIGGGGRSQTKVFPTPRQAAAAVENLIAEKRAKGYREVG